VRLRQVSRKAEDSATWKTGAGVRRKDLHHLNLLCDIGDLASLLAGSENIENFLQRTVEMVARHMAADVCSIYLYDENTEELVLEATIGLNPDAIGQVRMRIGEGLVGTALEKLEPVNEGFASRSPRFKYFEQAEEERFNSLLAVPILRGIEKIGVLVVQHEKRDYFDEIDVMAMRAIASQLAGAVGNARLLMDLNRRDLQLPSETSVPDHLRFIKGETAAGGYAFAPITVFDKSHATLLQTGSESGSDSGSRGSLNDFRRAIQMTAAQLEDFQSRFAERLPESASLIFSAHLMVLKDVRFVREMEKLIASGATPAAAVRSVAGHYIELFSSSTHAHIREKADDVQDLAGRILKNLDPRGQEDPYLRENHIVISRELFPSDILKLASEEVKGIILVSGGVTSHVAILSQSLQIPLIIADRSELLRLPEGTPVIMDAETGNIYVDPTDKIVQQFESQAQEVEVVESWSRSMAETTHTRDGIRVQLLANINILRDLKLARDLKAEGIGLYRTEFPFLIRSSLPSEEEQVQVYRRLFDGMAGKGVTIRTLDLGGDKLLAYTDAPQESNPELGLRSIRFTLHYPDLFRQQLRAILRAGSAAQQVRIMFPMISSLDEFLEARQLVRDCMAALDHEGLPHQRRPLIGTMIELPAVLEFIAELAETADFMSIGTNDFVQYMLAVDRTNERVAEYYRPYHPSVLRAIAKIAQAAQACGKECSVCGEMAHEPVYIPFFLGVGIRALSVYPKFLPVVQQTVAAVNLADTEAYARSLLVETTIKGVREVMESSALGPIAGATVL
jgi:phosphotransferase system, enzyme I, PtsP